MRRLVLLGISATLVLPVAAALAVAVVITTLATRTAAACGPGLVGVPASLTARTSTGVEVHLDGRQLAHAATIVEVGSTTDGVGRDGIIVALMAALTESQLRMLTNTGAYPESARFPNDGNGSDHDSLGLFQMRPTTGWGSVAELMDPEYQASAFFGGPTGPNHGSPRGLLDLPDWGSLSKGAAAQAVEVSAHPDRYAAYEPVAEAILGALTPPTPSGIQPAATTALLPHAATASPSPVAAEPRQPVTASRLVFPLPDGTWTRTSGFGHRVHPVYGTAMLHAGTDYAAASGSPVLALADGVVADVLHNARGGNIVVLDHEIDGKTVATAYAHLLEGSVVVQEGEPVAAGQQIGAVGATGAAAGAHLHLEIHPGGFAQPAVDPEPWLAVHEPQNLTEPAMAACTTGGSP